MTLLLAAAVLPSICASPVLAQAGSNGPDRNLSGAGKSEPPLISPLPEHLRWGDVMALQAMQFAVVPHGRANILFAWGPGEEGLSVRFRAALDAARPVEEVAIYSPGGSLDEGLEVGRLLHARKLATHILAGQRCISACNFIFMGGVIRYVDRGATFEVHMFSDNEVEKLKHDIVDPPKSYQALMRRFPTVDLDILVGAINASYPGLTVTAQTFQAARAEVRQQNRVDTSDPDAVNIETVRELVREYNAAHPTAQIDEEVVIMRLVLDEDVKSIQMNSAQTAASIARYLTEMSLSLRFLTRFSDIHNDKPTALTRDELREFNVINTD